jgi:hypothetical protein
MSAKKIAALVGLEQEFRRDGALRDNDKRLARAVGGTRFVASAD